MHVPTVFVEHGNIGSHKMMAEPMETLELHYLMIQFLICLFKRDYWIMHLKSFQWLSYQGIYTS